MRPHNDPCGDLLNKKNAMFTKAKAKSRCAALARSQSSAELKLCLFQAPKLSSFFNQFFRPARARAAQN